MAGVMAEIAAMGEGMPSNMPVAMLKVDTLLFVPAVDAVTRLREPPATRGLQEAHVIGMAVATGGAVIGEAVTGEAITGIRPMDILEWAIAIRITALTVTAMAGTMVRTTTDITLTATDIGRP
jgi:hypothetical protein